MSGTVTRPASKVQAVKLTDLPQTCAAPGWLIEDVKRNGVLEPVVLADQGDDGYKVLSGERRISAARALGLETIQANIVDWEDVQDRFHEVSVALNEKRASNHATNLLAVEALTKQGLSLDTIASRTGLTVPSAKAYLACSLAHGRAVVEFLAGGMTFGTLRRISRLPRATQTNLVEEELAPMDVGSGFTAKRLSSWIGSEKTIERWTEKAVDKLYEILDGPLDEEVRLLLENAMGRLKGTIPGTTSSDNQVQEV